MRAVSRPSGGRSARPNGGGGGATAGADVFCCPSPRPSPHEGWGEGDATSTNSPARGPPGGWNETGTRGVKSARVFLEGVVHAPRAIAFPEPALGLCRTFYYAVTVDLHVAAQGKAAVRGRAPSRPRMRSRHLAAERLRKRSCVGVRWVSMGAVWRGGISSGGGVERAAVESKLMTSQCTRRSGRTPS